MFNSEEKKMLLDLFHLYGPSNGEKPILEYIKSILKDNGIHYEEDDNGNIYCLNYKNEPLLSAHTDCVGTAESGAYVKLIDIYPYGDDEIMKGVGNIGGDDKCGVFLALLYLLSGKPINAVFSICEEIGGFDGIKSLINVIKDDEVFKTIPYCLVLDRRSCGDIICYNNSYGSKKFEEELTKIGKEYGYSPATGSCSDANTIKDYMNSCNLSVAYYNPHSTTEFVSINELYNTWNYVNALIEKMPRDILLEVPVAKTYNNYGNCSSTGYKDQWSTNKYGYYDNGYYGKGYWDDI